MLVTSVAEKKRGYDVDDGGDGGSGDRVAMVKATVVVCGVAVVCQRR